MKISDIYTQLRDLLSPPIIDNKPHLVRDQGSSQLFDCRPLSRGRSLEALEFASGVTRQSLTGAITALNAIVAS